MSRAVSSDDLRLFAQGMKNDTHSNPLPDRVRLIRIQRFFESSGGNPFSFVVGGGLSALALASVGIPASRLVIWFALILAVSCLIFFFERYVRRSALTLEDGPLQPSAQLPLSAQIEQQPAEQEQGGVGQ